MQILAGFRRALHRVGRLLQACLWNTNNHQRTGCLLDISSSGFVRRPSERHTFTMTSGSGRPLLGDIDMMLEIQGRWVSGMSKREREWESTVSVHDSEQQDLIETRDPVLLQQVTSVTAPLLIITLSHHGTTNTSPNFISTSSLFPHTPCNPTDPQPTCVS